MNQVTIPGMLLRALKECPRRIFLQAIDPEDPDRRPTSWSYEEFGFRVRQAIAFLQGLGIGRGSRLLILAENSPQWQVFALAGQCLQAEVVALFATLGSREVGEIVVRLPPQIAIVSNRVQLEKLLGNAEKLAQLEWVVILEESTQVLSKWKSKTYQQISEAEAISLDDLAKLVEAVHPEELFILLFTSGTTGRFKGVRLSHRAMLAAIEAGATSIGATQDSLGLLLLPFGHVAGQVYFYLPLHTQSSTIFCPNLEGLTRAFSQGPTHVLLVPFFYERLYGEVLKNIEKMPAGFGRLFKHVVRWGTQAGARRSGDHGKGFRAWLARLSLGKKLRKKLGGRLKIMACAGAPVDIQLVGFFRGIGFEFQNYYGMSETAGLIAADSVWDRRKKIGSVGRPWPTVEVSITAQGEIAVRGQSLFSGYLEREDEVNAFTDSGFFRTGDLGFLDQEGYLFVTGRNKNLIVLRTGEKISPEAVEPQLLRILPIDGAVALGDNENFLSAAVFVQKERLGEFQGKLGATPVEKYFLGEIRKGFSGTMDFAIPQRLLIIPGIPTDHSDLLTPTLKIKRSAFLATFQSQIKEIYGRRPSDKISMKP